MASVIAVSGGFLQITLNHYFHRSTCPGSSGRCAHRARGDADGPRRRGLDQDRRLLLRRRDDRARRGLHRRAGQAQPGTCRHALRAEHITNGFSGLAAGFPLAVYLFIGWENSAALGRGDRQSAAQRRPRGVPSIGIMVVSYLLFAYATRDRLRLQRHEPRQRGRSRSSRRAGHGRRAGVLRLPRRPDLDRSVR